MIEPSEHRPTQAIVDLKAVQHNLEIVLGKKQAQQAVYAVVKANAYGLGALAVSRAALEGGAQGLIVASVDEAIELRMSGLSQVPILILGLTDPCGIAEILHYNLTITLSDLRFLEQAYQQLADTGQLRLLDLYRLNFHLALDTGMGRIGLRTAEEVAAFVQGINQYPWAHWQGVYTHFATADGSDEDYMTYQWQQWQHLLEQVPAEVTVRHFANSALSLHHPELAAQSSILRYGIGLYGLDPADEYPSRDSLQPALQLISELVYVKHVPAGSHISYGSRYIAAEDEWIGTVPIGYGDGWLRAYQAIDLLVDGQRCPVVGVINMDQLMIRLPREYSVGSLVTLIGRDGSLTNHPSQLAQQVGTIGYELITNLSYRVPRVYLNT